MLRAGRWRQLTLVDTERRQGDNGAGHPPPVVGRWWWRGLHLSMRVAAEERGSIRDRAQTLHHGEPVLQLKNTRGLR